jgi:hypothetical protein
VANSFLHDNSKFHGIEWIYLVPNPQDKELLKVAVQNHSTMNPHHPEYWGGVAEMPDVYIAELCCDLHARSGEFGTSLKEYLQEVFMKKHNITTSMKVYRKIKYFMDLLLDEPFKKLGKLK